MRMPLETVRDPLTDEQWETVRTIAQAFAREQKRVDAERDGIATELKKVVSYLYTLVNNPNSDINQLKLAGSEFFEYLTILATDGKQVWRTGRTPDYYKFIDKVCRQTLSDYQNEPQKMLEILGWASRLVRYYKDTEQEVVIEQNAVVEGRNSQISTASATSRKLDTEVSSKYKLEQIVDATVIECTTKIVDAKKTKTTVVYAVDGERLVRTEEIYNIEKKGISLEVGKVIRLKILEISGGKIKKFERAPEV